MLTTIVKRLLQAVVVIFAVLILTFIILRMIPGDPVRTLLGHAKPEVMEAAKQELLKKNGGKYVSPLPDSCVPPVQAE